MKTQFDNTVRVVSLENLRAICEHVSGTCHRFEVTKVSRSRVHVEYSNPDEYGNEFPMTAVFPCYPSTFDGNENPTVVLGEIIRVIGDNWDGEGWQAFSPVTNGPKMIRSGEGSNTVWESERELYVRLTGATVETAWDKHGCRVLGWVVRPAELDRDQPIYGFLPGLVAPNDDAVIAFLRPIHESIRNR